MTRIQSSYSTTIGKKIAMATTGIVLVGYVVGHMLGNLKVYQGPEKLNAYAEFLREFGYPVLGYGEFLWIARVVLLASVIVHIAAAVSLTRRSRAARPTGYRNDPHEELTYASRTMRWGGTIILLFVIYHIMHLTLGSVHADFIPGDVYHNFVIGFQSWPVSIAYMIAVVAVGFHLYHGVWSMMQTLGINHQRINRYRRPVALAISGAVVAGNLSFPISVLAGWVTLAG